MRRPGTTQIAAVSMNHHITGVVLVIGERGDSAVPGQRVDTRAVAGELGRRQRGHADVQNDDLVAVHRDRRQIVVVLTIPAESKQRRLVGALIDDRGVLQIPRARTRTGKAMMRDGGHSRPRRSDSAGGVPEIKHANGAVGAH